MLVCVLLLEMAHGAAAEPYRPQQRDELYAFRLTSAGGGTIHVDGLIASYDQPGIFASVVIERALDDARSAVSYLPRVVEVGRRRSAGVTYGVTGCGYPVTCSQSRHGDAVQFTYSLSLAGDGESLREYTLLMALRGTITRVDSVRARGAWRKRSYGRGWSDVTSTMTRVGAEAPGVDAELFVAASAVSERPSVAIAIPPCDVIGAGAFTLEGGEQPVTEVCPSGPVSAVSMHATRWEVTGVAAGLAEHRPRLVTIGVPNF